MENQVLKNQTPCINVTFLLRFDSCYDLHESLVVLQEQQFSSRKSHLTGGHALVLELRLRSVHR